METGIWNENCIDFLRRSPPGAANLILTSLPGTKERPNQHGAVRASEWKDWFLEVADAVQPILHPQGSFVFEIKEPQVGGERSTCVIDTIIAMRGRGWIWADEYIWHMSNPNPGTYSRRFKDSFRRIFHFVVSPNYHFYPAQSKIPSRNGKSQVLPGNVLYCPRHASSRTAGHPTAWPLVIPEFFVRAATARGDIVVDPFCGGGNTGAAAIALGRGFVGVELDEKYARIASERLGARYHGKDTNIHPEQGTPGQAENGGPAGGA